MRSLSEVSEDYLRLVAEISERHGYAKPRDLSCALNVSPASVTQMVRKLSADGLLEYESHGAIALTEDGRAIASSIRRRHDFFLMLLESAGVARETALAEAHSLEHGISDETLARLLSIHGRLSQGR